MKATLEFDLPADADNYLVVSNASKLHSALYDIQEKLRNMYKYESDSFTEEQHDLLEKIRDSVIEILNDNNVPLELRY